MRERKKKVFALFFCHHSSMTLLYPSPTPPPPMRAQFHFKYTWPWTFTFFGDIFTSFGNFVLTQLEVSVNQIFTFTQQAMSQTPIMPVGMYATNQWLDGLRGDKWEMVCHNTLYTYFCTQLRKVNSFEKWRRWSWLFLPYAQHEQEKQAYF